MARSRENDEQINTIINDNHERVIDEDEEERHFRKVVSAFLYYR
jgi:hypothetical protein